jgi:PBSX family phage terminase large subunit
MHNEVEYLFSINKYFLPIWNNTNRYLILWGGRGSSKTDFIAKKLITRCYSNEYFRFILVRNNYNSIKDSQWQTIKDIITEAGLESEFDFKLQPLEIICKHNGNKFIARGCDDTTKLKSVKDPTGAWYEEDIPNESDFITITTSIRTNKANYLQEIFTINPEVEGNYEDNWFWKRFFKGQPEKSFSGSFTIDIDKQPVKVTYTAHHSTYHDNRWLPIEFKAFLEDLKRTNPYYYTIYTLGEWGNKVVGGRFYRSFDRSKHLTDQEYNCHLPLHVSFDFNVKPYMSMSIWQVVSKKAVQVDEIAAKEPNNHTSGICREFARKYAGHKAGLFIYGDPSGFHEDTRQDQKGHNDYYIIMNELKQFDPKSRVAKSAPPIVSRGNFINQIFEIKQGGIEVLINSKCSYSIMDLVYLKEMSDGTKHKEKGKDESGVTSEKYGHFSDGMDYFLTEIFRTEFNQYLDGGTSGGYEVGNDREYVFEHDYDRNERFGRD